eukprot:TRINITY_DN33426_c0_g1_i1.p1 TRINITY_DN33426_c0_g1~~TRINITY_DN33426_c0_g1_i1.p1  ORF type:complete len:221 (+),score=48.39 TRINITY_DN33426_c0_g1_i1:58-720(+)
MKLAVIIFIFTLASVYAPFPAGHPYNWANPYIEPVWEKFSKETQAEVYRKWLTVAPFKLALQEYKDKLDRRKMADAAAWEAAKQLIGSKLKELKQAFAGQELKPSIFSVTKDEQNHQEKVRIEQRYQTKTQIKWERFQSAFQHALYLRLAEKRALYQKFLERARLHGRQNKAAKRKLIQVKDSIEESYIENLEKLKDKLYKTWLAGEEVKDKIRSEFKKF